MKIYITDKSGKKFWNTDVTYAYCSGERNNLQRHLTAIKDAHPAYAKCIVDAQTARLVEELNDEEKLRLISDEDLLEELVA